MSFGDWFERWVRSIRRLLAAGSPRGRYKSFSERRYERGRRLIARRAESKGYRKKKRWRRRSSHVVRRERFTRALFRFAATSLGILLLPFGLFDWGRKSAEAKRRAKENRSLPHSAQNGSDSTAASPKRTKPAQTEKKEAVARPSAPRCAAVEQTVKPKAEIPSGLDKMCAADERFKKSIDKYGEGTAEFASYAIEILCKGRNKS